MLDAYAEEQVLLLTLTLTVAAAAAAYKTLLTAGAEARVQVACRWTLANMRKSYVTKVAAATMAHDEH